MIARLTKPECLTARMQVLGDVQTTYRNFAVYAADNSPASRRGHSASPMTARCSNDWPASGPEPPLGRYVLGVDGHAVGHTHQHGRSVHWWG